jgi:hypothetical protein
MLVLAERACVAVLLVVGTLATACRSKANEHAKAAQEEFSRTFSCPVPSTTVTPRPDLKAYDLQTTPSSPPAEVAADPARLAEWKRRQDKSREGYDNMTVQQASGCGHAVYYTCSLATSSNDEQVVACSVAQHPPK